MRHKYVLCPNGQLLTAESKVFCVWVGESDRDFAKKCLVEHFCDDNNLIFRPWDEDTDFYLLTFSQVHPAAKGVGAWPFQSIELTITQCYRHIIDGTLMSVPVPPHQWRNHLHLLSIFDPLSSSSKTGSVLHARASRVTRKNLKPSPKDELTSVLVSFGVILLLYLVVAYFEANIVY